MNAPLKTIVSLSILFLYGLLVYLVYSSSLRPYVVEGLNYIFFYRPNFNLSHIIVITSLFGGGLVFAKKKFIAKFLVIFCFGMFLTEAIVKTVINVVTQDELFWSLAWVAILASTFGCYLKQNYVADKAKAFYLSCLVAVIISLISVFLSFY